VRLNKQLTINQVTRQLIAEKIVLDLFAPGRAQFTLMSSDNEVKVGQLVVYEFGYSSQDNLQRFFIGSVDKVVHIQDSQTRVFCREISAALANPLALNLRHVSLRDVATEINNITGLNFSIPDQPYADAKVANFYCLGSGYLAMQSMGSVFNIADMIWQQQGAGVIFAGSWADSRWSSIKNMLVPNNLFDNHSVNESARIAAIPQLRPGMRINHNRLTKIEFEKNHMILSWGK
jgi:hypothetical protein